MTAATSLPWWDDLSQSWDIVYLSGVAFPGNVVISGGVERDIDVKKTKGQDGATLKDNGYKPSQIDITLRISTQSEWEDLQILLPLIHPRSKGGERNPVTLGHPASDLLGISTMYVKKIGLPVVEDNKEISISISGFEWIQQPKPVKKGAGGGTGGSGKGNADDDLAEDPDQYILDEEEAAYEEALRKWREENEPLGDNWPVDEEDEKAFAKEYYDGNEGDDSWQQSEDGEENIEDLSDYEDGYGWT